MFKRKVVWQCWNGKLIRLLNLSFDMGVVPMDWRGACTVPLYKGKGTNVNVATREVLVCRV